METINSIAIHLRDSGQLEQSHSLFQQLVDSRREANGATHPLTLYAIGSLSSVSQMRGHLIEAEALAREAVDGAREMLGGKHPDTLGMLTNLSNVLKDQGKLCEAEPLAREAVEGCRDMMGSSHPDTLISLSNLTQVLLARGKLEEAERLAREEYVARDSNAASTPWHITSTEPGGRLWQPEGEPSATGCRAPGYARLAWQPGAAARADGTADGSGEADEEASTAQPRRAGRPPSAHAREHQQFGGVAARPGAPVSEQQSNQTPSWPSTTLPTSLTLPTLPTL